MSGLAKCYSCLSMSSRRLFRRLGLPAWLGLRRRLTYHGNRTELQTLKQAANLVRQPPCSKDHSPSESKLVESARRIRVC